MHLIAILAIGERRPLGARVWGHAPQENQDFRPSEIISVPFWSL